VVFSADLTPTTPAAAALPSTPTGVSPRRSPSLTTGSPPTPFC
jgi:hypothetical protein